MIITKNTPEDIKRLTEKFMVCRRLLTALGDQTRQHLLFIMMSGECYGSSVLDLSARTNLSRPAVSRHIQVLKEAGIVKSRREGRHVYYYLEPEISDIDSMISLFSDMKRITEQLPDRSGDE